MMIEDIPSATAFGVCAMRAFEDRKEPAIRICEDSYAMKFLELNPKFSGSNWLARNIFVPGRKKLREIAFHLLLPGLQESIATRSRYIDDVLQRHLRRGIKQLVILGAGFDTRPYRIQAVQEQQVKTFEVDHPATQKFKQMAMGKMLKQIPEHVEFVSVDFEKEKFGPKLLQQGYNPKLKTLFIWEGVVMYIGQEAIDETLDFIVSHSTAESSVIFDYYPQSVIQGDHPNPVARRIQRQVKKAGEPFTFGINPEQITPFLKERGFVEVKPVNLEKTQQQYLKDNWKKRKSVDFALIVEAKVGSSDLKCRTRRFAP